MATTTTTAGRRKPGQPSTRAVTVTPGTPPTVVRMTSAPRGAMGVGALMGAETGGTRVGLSATFKIGDTSVPIQCDDITQGVEFSLPANTEIELGSFKDAIASLMKTIGGDGAVVPDFSGLPGPLGALVTAKVFINHLSINTKTSSYLFGVRVDLADLTLIGNLKLTEIGVQVASGPS